jgi:hypothetical protein
MADLVYAINMTLMPLIDLQFIYLNGRDTSKSIPVNVCLF